MSCTDCHDPHAPAERPLLGGFKQVACLHRSGASGGTCGARAAVCLATSARQATGE
jgi:predicted CXXCH cytochrome family protein